MNKEFEKQYKDYITEQVPDMWSRIEAGLKDKNEIQRTMTDVSAERKHVDQAGAERRHIWRKNKTVTIFVPAVAAVCLCLLVPAALLGGRSKSDGGTMNASPMLSEERKFDEMENGGEAVEKEEMVGNAAESGGIDMEAAGEASEDTGMENSASMKDIPTKIQAFLRVKIRIDEIMEAADLEYDAIYLAEILEIVEAEEEQTADSVLEGTKICFYVGEDTDKTEGETPPNRGRIRGSFGIRPRRRILFCKKNLFYPINFGKFIRIFIISIKQERKTGRINL